MQIKEVDEKEVWQEIFQDFLFDSIEQVSYPHNAAKTPENKWTQNITGKLNKGNHTQIYLNASTKAFFNKWKECIAWELTCCNQKDLLYGRQCTCRVGDNGQLFPVPIKKPACHEMNIRDFSMKEVSLIWYYLYCNSQWII